MVKVKLSVDVRSWGIGIQLSVRDLLPSIDDVAMFFLWIGPITFSAQWLGPRGIEEENLRRTTAKVSPLETAHI